MTLPIYSPIQKQEPNFSNDSHRGLLFERFFNAYEDNFSILKSKKIDGKDKDESPRTDWLIKSFTRSDVGISDELTRYTKNQIELTTALAGKCVAFKSSWHFVTGMGNPHPVENGFSWHPTLGVPYLTGAAVKGLIRSYFENNYSELDKEGILWQWFGSTDKDSKKQTKDYPAIAGEVIFFDAVPLEPVQLGVDVMTPHLGDWYEKGDTIQNIATEPNNVPADWHDPVPVTFLVAKNITLLFSFTLRTFERNPADKRKPVKLDDVGCVLEQALDYAGAGAKTATGYGSFKFTDEALKEHSSRFKTLLTKWQENEEITRIKKMTLEDRKLFELQKSLNHDKEKGIKQAGGTTSNQLANLLEEGKTWSFEYRIRLSDLAEAVYNWHGWGPKHKVDSKKTVLALLKSTS
ncbi:type III-B CRISPR module RAMP protein Cmr6 [uncultured Thiothrix sp.]|uniref:type III-B CRISPR module RAMP protein Cmr6 n=1 Tax=uncultured Thiothrix sp. TaxID=223185 RepID=UPI00262EDCC4|nr:type III-B CRISPR module RAMP protein Cmr6 [uncultured Thiothrix sp.]